MKNLLLAAVVACLAVPAWAFNPGETTLITGTVLCDTQDQMHSILEAGQSSTDEAITTFRGLTTTPSPYGGPACVYIGEGQSAAVRFVRNIYAMDNVSLARRVVHLLDHRSGIRGRWRHLHRLYLRGYPAGRACLSALSVTDEDCQAAWDAYLAAGKNATAACEALDMPRTTFRNRLKMAKERGLDEIPLHHKLSRDYDLNMKEKTAQEAWDEHATTFERTASKILSEQWRQIERKGPFVIFHSTDEHIDDNAAPLKLIEADIKAAHEMNSIMCHGGDALNNWRLAGRLAAEWARQQCTLPDALLRLEHFISIFKPDVWTDGNHEEMNPYLAEIIKKALPENVIRGDWTANFVVKTDGRPVRAIMSHKFQKGGSWFHKAHGHIREMLEGEEADLLMDGHLHSDGVLDHTLPERGYSALCVASGGYKLLDKYAGRISRGGRIPKLRGRAHWIVCDPHADPDENLCTAFKSPQQAEAYFGALQNLRAI